MFKRKTFSLDHEDSSRNFNEIHTTGKNNRNLAGASNPVISVSGMTARGGPSSVKQFISRGV